MTRWTTLALFLAISLSTFAQKPDEPSPEPPPPEPITMQFVGKREATLDLGGKTVDAFRKEVEAGRFMPPPLTSDLKLRITNNSKETIRLRAIGSTNRLVLTLTGKGGVKESTQARPRPKIEYTILKPGDSFDLPLNQLLGYYTTSVTYPVPLGLGEYQLKAALTLSILQQAGVAVPVKGKKAKGPVAPGRVKFGVNTLTTPPLTLTVKSK